MQCNKIDGESVCITCPVCEGAGCKECSDGEFSVDCPVRFISDMTEPAQVSAMCNGGSWPIAGGIMDQSAWFMKFHHRLTSETAEAESEVWKRKNGK